MNLTQILVLSAITLLIAWITPARWRNWLLLATSILAIFWLQPASSIRNFDFWFPLASISLTILVWAMTSKPQNGLDREDLIGAGVIVGIILLIAATRYMQPFCCLTATRPPQIQQILLALITLVAVTLIVNRYLAGNQILLAASILVIIILFIILKTEPLADTFSMVLRNLTRQDPTLASAVDIRWLGFSYLAFRWLHSIRDRQSNKLPSFSIRDYTTYAIFYPTITAGPIDRSQRFVENLRHSFGERSSNTILGSQRIIIGLFKKFVIADGLALIALNEQNAFQSNESLWAWVLLYAYALRIYFDFSGYTDIALGLAQIVGIKLPENFQRPYIKTNLTAFWNSWHITLAQWFRSYYFNPLTRALRSSRFHPPAWFTILIGQTTTMLLIGLWHGVTWNFAIWGLWHGVGLFIHNRWTAWLRPRQNWFEGHPTRRVSAVFGGWLITFNFVALGWVWFALPSPLAALAFFQTLFGN